MTVDARASSRSAYLASVGGILLAWSLALAVENLAVGLGYRALFVATWEMGIARMYASPLFLVALAPLAFVLPLGVRLVAPHPRRVFGLAATFAAAVLWGCSEGRHFARLPTRVAFVALFALILGGGVAVVAPRALRARAHVTSAVAAVATVALWLVDAFALPRLYPAFHLGIFALSVAAAAVVVSPWVSRRTGFAGLALACLSLPLALLAPKKLANADNLRLVLVDHAPWLGRAVVLAARVVPPPPLDEDAIASAAPGEVARALDWTGRDIVLVSIDATRADHVSAYGYGRPTTPNLDRMAQHGALFTHAYCPTPHTSYSVTSMMTGKYMRPLLSLGLGDDSDTWAGLVRRYGFRTAAFYPPAVFFIDEPRFTTFRDRSLDFEYRKIEFAPPDVRRAQVERYLSGEEGKGGKDRGKPLFLWLHLFEPHEPYVAQPAHPFGDPGRPRDEDAYDSEIAEADALVGWLAERMEERARSRGAGKSPVFIVTADHGEEFGDHGGRYHGTTVYEEQVRVPLIISGHGVAQRRFDEPVQTIDLLPTTLSALGIPRPARIRGRDLGPILAGAPKTEGNDSGYAYAETEDFTLLASGNDRLVCRRKIGACALYDVAADPKEAHDVAALHAERVQQLRGRTASVERDHGKLEHGTASDFPDAIRRGLAGDADVAEEAASLLDDVSVTVRRKAGEVAYHLHDARTLPSLRRSLSRETDDETRRWVALALVRAKDPPSALAGELLTSPDTRWQRLSALAFAALGDRRGEGALVAWWGADDVDFERARELLSAYSAIKSKRAVPIIVKSLADARLRPYLAETLAAIGDTDAKRPLLAALAEERYVSLRAPLAKALLALGANDELRAPLRRFAGMPDPMPEAIELLADSGGLAKERAAIVQAAEPRLEGTLGATTDEPTASVPAECRLIVLLADASDEAPSVTIDRNAPHAATDGHLRVHWMVAPCGGGRAITISHAKGVRAAWLVRRVLDLPPPAALPWDAGSEVDPEVPDGGDPR